METQRVSFFGGRLDEHGNHREMSPLGFGMVDTIIPRTIGNNQCSYVLRWWTGPAPKPIGNIGFGFETMDCAASETGKTIHWGIKDGWAIAVNHWGDCSICFGGFYFKSIGLSFLGTCFQLTGSERGMRGRCGETNCRGCGWRRRGQTGRSLGS